MIQKLTKRNTFSITEKKNEEKLGGDDSISIGTFVVDIPNEIVMQANAIGVSRSDVSGTAFKYFSSFFFKKKKKKE